ncbi:DUF427-domain-containing protein [Atractiella rhizophila]|nr:DUF427-domain-containing protein [Atractiella rhizophila]
MENPTNYPRPAKLDPSNRRVKIVWDGEGEDKGLVIVDSTRAVRALETNHPPAWYIPREDVKMELLKVHEKKSSFCPWKGQATYYDLFLPSSKDPSVRVRAWSYLDPIADFASLKGYLAFYATSSPHIHAHHEHTRGSWKAYVDDEEVDPEPDHYFGGWYTKGVEKIDVPSSCGTGLCRH